jgi:sulfoxide reductase heme-binding subunit YedZ
MRLTLAGPPPVARSAAEPARAAPRARRAPLRQRVLAGATFVLCLAPAAKIVLDALLDRLGANPIEAIQSRLGFWTLGFLTLSLVPTPLRALFGLSWPIRLRRTVGLFAFAYATLHLVWYVAVDQTLDLGLLVEDVAKRKFMTVGFTAWVLLSRSRSPPRTAG